MTHESAIETPAKPVCISEKLKYTRPVAYSAYWHLLASGILRVEGGKIKSDVWVNPDRPVYVAMIDNGVDIQHPYVESGICHAIDLTAMPASVMDPSDIARMPGPFVGIVAAIDELKSAHAAEINTNGGNEEDSGHVLDVEDFSVLTAFAARFESLAAFDNTAPNTANRRFSMHGTSAAGLVMARPPNQPLEKVPANLNYYGADPAAFLIPITTSYAARPEKLLLAFLYALARKADVIFVPRSFSWSLIDDENVTSEAPMGKSNAHNAAEDAKNWRLLRKVIIAVSKLVPVVCASGNSGESRLIAPAVLANENEFGGANGVIAVGAMNYFGMRASYSTYGEGLTLVAPSDDGEMFTRDQIRLDNTDRTVSDFPYGIMAVRKNMDDRIYDYAYQDILAIDIAGEFGWDTDNVDDGAATQYGGYFTGFGGTSAASAIVAGVCSLVQRTAKSKPGGKRLTGIEMKDHLAKHARKKGLPHIGGAGDTTEFKPDFINGAQLTPEQAFGAGLIDAAAAVKHL